MSDEQPPNSALDVKLDYIQKDIGEIKKDIKEIKTDYIIRREFNEALLDIRRQLAFFQKIVYSVFSVMGLGLAAAVFKLVFK
jgi:hypothetical protein